MSWKHSMAEGQKVEESSPINKLADGSTLQF